MPDFLFQNWKLLDLLLIVTGLVVYGFTSQTLRQRRHPSAAIAWLMGMVFFPWGFLPLFVIFGNRKLKAHRMRPPPQAPKAPARKTSSFLVSRTQALAHIMGMAPPSDASYFALHEDGHAAYLALQKVIFCAKERLDISTFLLGRDIVGKQITDWLITRATSGIAVRLLIDGAGFYMGGCPNLKALQRAGVCVLRFVPPFSSTKPGRTNLRNHRKMVIADKTHFWCGGRNMASEYFMGDPYSFRYRQAWVDLSFSLSGSIAEDAHKQFSIDWNFAKGESWEERPWEVQAPALTQNVQMIDSGPDRPDDPIHTLLLSACFLATKEITFVSPYFVPDLALLNAMTLAARRGVIVRVIAPAKSNHRMADIARARAFRDIVAAGGSVWLHPTMLHAKVFLIDQKVAFCGSANLDGRSLFLNYELLIAFYENAAIAQFVNWVEKRALACQSLRPQQASFARFLLESLVLWLGFQL